MSKAREYLQMVAEDFATNRISNAISEDSKPIGKNRDGSNCYDPNCGNLAYKFSDDREDQVPEGKAASEMYCHGGEINDIISHAKSISKEIAHGRWIHQRVPQEALRGLQADSKRLVEAIDVCRRNESPSGTAPTGVRGENDRIAAIEREYGKRQEIDLEDYAKSEGIWKEKLDKKLIGQFGESCAGGETIVFFDEKNKKAHKLITNSFYRQPIEALDRIVLHNWIFPETAMKVVGFGRTEMDWSGNADNPMFVTEVEQPFIRIARGAKEGEIEDYMRGIGFEKWKKDWWRSKDGSILVGDLHDENAVVDDHGNFCVIDADLRLNTPALGLGGNYRIGK